MTQFGIFRSPRIVVFGAQQRLALGRIARKFGKRAFICTDSRLTAGALFPSMIESLHAAGVETKLFDETIPELPADNARQCADAARSFKPDIVVGLGGGSCIDLAKATALMLVHGDKISDFYGEALVPGPVLPVIAIPTTSGTGSEVSPVAVVTDPAHVMKIGISSSYLVPEVAICDPELTCSCPPSLTANSGVDALTHAIEAFTAVRRPATPDSSVSQVFIGKNDLSDHYAVAAISHVSKSLLRAIENGNDADARSDLMLGALYAGFAFGAAGTAAAHAIQYPVGAATHSAHGFGVATLLPYVMEYNRPARVEEFAQIAMAMDPSLKPGDPQELAFLAVERVSALLYAAGVPRNLSGLGLREDQVKWTAEQAVTVVRLVKNNPRPLDLASIEDITRAAFKGNRSSLRGA